ncbi:MAG: LamG-like jellyroll fold domain-containing protein [Chitinophagaceae bacterium]
MKKPYTSILFFLICPLFLFAQSSENIVGKYQLNNSAIDISGNEYNGTLNSTTAAPDRFGVAGAATDFIQGVSSGKLPLELVTPLSNDFSLGYWFKTTMTANNSSQWYGGNAMVDAEVCGGTTDWGTALIDGGKVCFGIGNPDITIKSTNNYNDGNWHFVTITRNKTSATISLYVDGALVASTPGTTPASLVTPTFVGLGINPCNSSPMYTGILDDIVAYNRELSNTEVITLYNYYNENVLPLKWQSYNGNVNGSRIVLNWRTENSVNNDHFEIEHSIDGINFSIIGTVAEADYTFTYTDANPAKGNNFYRIRQVDKDGRYTFSSIIKLVMKTKGSGLHLQTNPVPNELVLVNNDQVMIQRVQVADMSGRLLKEHSIQSNIATIKIPMQYLKPGNYILKIISVGDAKSIKIIKR